MAIKKPTTAIVSRSFWPDNPAIGEALLLLAESLGKQSDSLVITQVSKNFPELLKKSNRGRNVIFSTLPSLTNSSSPILLRIGELLLFTGFTFASLSWHRPDQVYVATNPPVFTPLAVRWYCGIFNKKYIYHLQDIHPEITSIVTGKRNVITQLISHIDTKTIAKASSIITLTEQMKSYINKRARRELPVKLLPNPSVQSTESGAKTNRVKGFVYCGNAGRLQRIPLLIEAIKKYLDEGGSLPFVFAGGGIFKEDIRQLASIYENVTYKGVLSACNASQLLHEYSFGLMPIEDEVTSYAFPSKSSSYVFSGCRVIAICGEDTSVASWVRENELGYVVEPEIEVLANFFHRLEKLPLSQTLINSSFFEKLTPAYHAKALEEILQHI